MAHGPDHQPGRDELLDHDADGIRADAVLVDSAALSVAQRLGKPEKLERAESRDLGLRVFIGKRQAIVSTTDTSPAMLAELLERAIAMARSVACPGPPHRGCPQPWRVDGGSTCTVFTAVRRVLVEKVKIIVERVSAVRRTVAAWRGSRR